MLNFHYANPTRLIFGAGQFAALPELLKPYQTILVLLDPAVEQIHQLALKLTNLFNNKQVYFYMDIPCNSELSNLSEATQLARDTQADFILAIGGGSTIDAAKFISCAVNYPHSDLWQIMLESGHAEVKQPLALGSVVTYPSAGSEMNPYFVASNRALQRKMACYAPMVYPQFTILDPNLTASLSSEQLALGIADSFIHILEQFVTSDQQAALQDFQAASLLKTLINSANQLENISPHNSELGNIMLASTFALNGWIECGIASDWTTHWISHELTALYGLCHAQAVLVVLPAVWTACRAEKTQQLLKYAYLVWGIQRSLEVEVQISQAFAKTWEFFRSLGLKLSLTELGIKEIDKERIIANVFDFSNGKNLGERQNLDQLRIRQILDLI